MPEQGIRLALTGLAGLGNAPNRRWQILAGLAFHWRSALRSHGSGLRLNAPVCQRRSASVLQLMQNAFEQRGHFMGPTVDFRPWGWHFGLCVAMGSAFPAGIELRCNPLAARRTGPHLDVAGERFDPSFINSVRLQEIPVTLDPQFGVDGCGRRNVRACRIANEAGNANFL